MTTPGCVTARSPWWRPCPCPWGVLWFSWTSCWYAASLWISRGCCWPRLNCLAVWGLQSSLQPPESSLHWAATSSSAVTPPDTQHQLWPGSKPQPTLVSNPGFKPTSTSIHRFCLGLRLALRWWSECCDLVLCADCCQQNILEDSDQLPRNLESCKYCYFTIFIANFMQCLSCFLPWPRSPIGILTKVWYSTCDDSAMPLFQRSISLIP